MNRNLPEVSVLFVCMGNICRSPAAEGVCKALVDQRSEKPRVLVDSAGTIGYHSGKPPDARMVAAAARRGWNLTSRARQVTRADLDLFDHVIAMDQDNLAGLRSLHSAPRARLALFSHWLDLNRWPRDVPDPYYGGPAGFDEVLDMLQAGMPLLLEEILAQSGGHGTAGDPETTPDNPHSGNAT